MGLYKRAFNPVPITSGYDGPTKGLFKFEGTHGDTTTTDTVAIQTITLSSGAIISQDYKKFGNTALYLPGGSAAGEIAYSDYFNLSTLPEGTIDFWIYFTHANTTQARCVGWDSSDYNLAFLVCYSDGTLHYVAFSDYSHGASISLGDYSSNTWYHIALVKELDSGVVKIYKNGILQGTLLASYFSQHTPMRMGFLGRYEPMQGYIDELRISTTARWIGDFTPPVTEYLPNGTPENMTLISASQVATIVPTMARIILFEEDIDSVTLNTDLKAYISRDNGATYSSITLEDCGNYMSGCQIIQGEADISSQPSGSNIKYKVETLNNKILHLHGTAVSWK